MPRFIRSLSRTTGAIIRSHICSGKRRNRIHQPVCSEALGNSGAIGSLSERHRPSDSSEHARQRRNFCGGKETTGSAQIHNLKTTSSDANNSLLQRPEAEKLIRQAMASLPSRYDVITGCSGVGKSTLVREVARTIPNAVYIAIPVIYDWDLEDQIADTFADAVGWRNSKYELSEPSLLAGN